jgi:acyl phosphate:glycerol-3-phosphate acyltransferase
VITVTLVVLAAYGLGAVPFAYVVARRFAGVDVRAVGSGNVGATNVARTAGATLAVIVLALDIGKGAVAVWLAQWMGLPEAIVVLVGLAAIVGHIFPVWLGFRGGKGVATACGVFALLAPHALLVSVLAFFFFAWATRYVSLGSVVGAVVLPIAAVGAGESPATVLAACATAILVLWRHRDNMTRLLAGTEPKFGRGLEDQRGA